MPLTALMAQYDNLILDLDGTVWVGDELTPRAGQAVAALRAGGKRLIFLTNDGRHTPEEYVQRLWRLGCTAGAEEIVSVGSAIQYELASRADDGAVYVIGAPAIFRHVTDAGRRIVNHTDDAETADTVVVVAHDELTYVDLRTAVRAVNAGADMLSGGRDPSYLAAGGPAPGTGAVLAALEFATGRTARSVGKPDPQVFRIALERIGGGRTLVIGDHLSADLGGADAAGLPAALVLSGVSTAAQAAAAANPSPVAVGADLATLVLS